MQYKIPCACSTLIFGTWSAISDGDLMKSLQVTKRVDTNEGDWAGWNWRTDGDIMVNGAFFVPSGAGLSAQYSKASSVEPKSSGLIQQLTLNAGVFGDPR